MNLDISAWIDWLFDNLKLTLTLGGVAFILKKLSFSWKKQISEAKGENSVAQTQSSEKQEESFNMNNAHQDNCNNNNGGNQFVNCNVSVAHVFSSTEKEIAAKAIKHAISLYFSSVLGNPFQEDPTKRDGGLLDYRNRDAVGKIKSSCLFNVLSTFRNQRTKLQRTREDHATKLAEEDQKALRRLFNHLIGESPREINAVTEADIHAITEGTREIFTKECNAILDKY